MMNAYLMMKAYRKARDLVERLRTDQNGMVSFEYIIVAICIIGAVSLAFGTGTNGLIYQALSHGISAVTSEFTSAI